MKQNIGTFRLKRRSVLYEMLRCFWGDIKTVIYAEYLYDYACGCFTSSVCVIPPFGRLNDIEKGFSLKIAIVIAPKFGLNHFVWGLILG